MWDGKAKLTLFHFVLAKVKFRHEQANVEIVRGKIYAHMLSWSANKQTKTVRPNIRIGSWNKRWGISVSHSFVDHEPLKLVIICSSYSPPLLPLCFSLSFLLLFLSLPLSLRHLICIYILWWTALAVICRMVVAVIAR